MGGPNTKILPVMEEGQRIELELKLDATGKPTEQQEPTIFETTSEDGTQQPYAGGLRHMEVNEQKPHKFILQDEDGAILAFCFEEEVDFRIWGAHPVTPEDEPCGEFQDVPLYDWVKICKRRTNNEVMTHNVHVWDGHKFIREFKMTIDEHNTQVPKTEIRKGRRGQRNKPVVATLERKHDPDFASYSWMISIAADTDPCLMLCLALSVELILKWIIDKDEEEMLKADLAVDGVRDVVPTVSEESESLGEECTPVQ
jgi:hypothetical protein